MEFSPTGTLLLIGGQSSMFSIYDFTTRSIIRRLLLSQNMSIEGTNVRVYLWFLLTFGRFSRVSIHLHSLLLIRPVPTKKLLVRYRLQELLAKIRLNVRIDRRWKFAHSHSIRLVNFIITFNFIHKIFRSIVCCCLNRRRPRLFRRQLPKIPTETLSRQSYAKECPGCCSRWEISQSTLHVVGFEWQWSYWDVVECHAIWEK